eukprot:Skav206718  [mRNA]  locus=scaffold967:100591:105014:+ [translate_table: standard]
MRGASKGWSKKGVASAPVHTITRTSRVERMALIISKRHQPRVRQVAKLQEPRVSLCTQIGAKTSSREALST